MLPEDSQFKDKSELLIDASTLAESLGISLEQVNKFTHLFIKTAKQNLVELENTIRIQDLKLAALVAHRLKSSSSTVGAQQFSERCQILESFKDGGDVVQAKDILHQLQSMLKAIENDMERRI